MKSKTKILIVTIAVIALFVVSVLSINKTLDVGEIVEVKREKGCVFMTTFGEQPSEGYAQFKLRGNIQPVVDDGLAWLAKAQLKNGGYGAGSHSRQGEMNPHAVNADPATTSMVAMAILRSGSTLKNGEYKEQLKKALNFLLTEVESVSKDDTFITSEKGTQIQRKLGNNIDAVLTAQFFSNLLKDKLDKKQKNVLKSV